MVNKKIAYPIEHWNDVMPRESTISEELKLKLFMNPWIKIWTNVESTIDYVRGSRWVDRYGITPFLLMGINNALSKDFGSDMNRLFGTESNLIAIVTSLLLGILSGIIFYEISVNLVFYFGRIWKGQGSKRDIFSVISLSLIPEVLPTFELVFKGIIHGGNSEHIQNSYVLIFICGIISIRILIIGLSRVQRFSYGTAVLNVIFPYLILTIIYLFIRGL